MRTMVNGQPAEWTQEIYAKWYSAAFGADPKFYEGVVAEANYFTPRPWVDEYNRGDKKEGFTYVRVRPSGPDVIAVCINGFRAGIVAPQERPNRVGGDPA